MKTYLVHYSTGWGSDTSIVKTKDDYVPESDNMMTLAKLVIEKEHPKYMRAYAAPDSCGGGVSLTESGCGEIKPKNLEIMAVSRLDL